MKLKILSWNVRGANDKDKRKVIKAFLNSQKAELVCLQETKMQNVDSRMVRSLGAGRNSQWAAVDACGAAGGILLFWDFRVLELVDIVVGLFSISCRFSNCEDDFQWTFSGVYGHVFNCNRDPFWEELRAIRGLWEGPWSVGGDF